MKLYISAIFNVLYEFKIHILFPLMLILRLGKCILHLNYLYLCVFLIGLFMVIKNFKHSWFNIYLIHLTYFILFQVPRFVSLINVLNRWFELAEWPYLFLSISFLVSFS